MTNPTNIRWIPLMLLLYSFRSKPRQHCLATHTTTVPTTVPTTNTTLPAYDGPACTYAFDYTINGELYELNRGFMEVTLCSNYTVDKLQSLNIMTINGTSQEFHVPMNLTDSDTAHVRFNISEPFENYDDIWIMDAMFGYGEGFCVASVNDVSIFDYSRCSPE